ncbi:lipoteichoic acid stability factor AuxB [Staphylococcus caeli]|uniref:Membrane protein n=1 Tax=Staphylococcus caeli TaxID=2201815 RepID=A0A1D4IHM3_9STAP|nr:DUF4064 domain-containing protein [Staphylococcus caeli]SCS49095.1 membrane protein [Staphylococcus caeli]SCS94263.1 membrane protein [Staphylococcus caeli]
MSGEQYTQVRRPVSRLAEKVLGWLSWVFLLLLTVITMFIALVSFSSETSIQNLETTLNGNDFVQQILASNSLNTTQFVIWLQNGVWAVIVYFIVCLLLSFLALISMNIRILSGFLFLIATVVTLPLVLLFVPLIIPILFFIVAIMMFARKDKIETVPMYYNEGYQGRYADYEQPSQPSPQYYEREQSSGTEQQVSHDNQLRRGGYTSEVAEKVNGDNHASEEEPQVLSRQAKYNYKQKQQDESQSTNDEFGNVSNVYDEQGYSEADYNQQQQDAEDKKRRQQAEAEEAARLKQEKAEEKARIKQEKKERRQREKERRKQQPSAVNQRRQNFEERKKMTSHEAQSEETKAQSKETEQQNSDKS